MARKEVSPQDGLANSGNMEKLCGSETTEVEVDVLRPVRLNGGTVGGDQGGCWEATKS